MTPRRASALACALFLLSLSARAEEKPRSITVLAAASLADVLPRVAELWKKESGVSAVFDFDATSRLARQAEAGVPADLFFSADKEWMDYAAEKDFILSATRRDVAGNFLAAVVAKDSRLTIKSVSDLARARRVALAGENVPAGRYAEAALRWAGVWTDLEKRVVRAENVRGALKWAADQEVEAAVVYKTDALVEPRVEIAFVFPAASHAPIVYPAAVLKQSKAAAAAGEFLKFCATPAARNIFRRAGFKA